MKIHFIGIGGIGVSALAQYYLSKGCKVSGSDLVSSEITDFLKDKGAEVFIGPHSGNNLSSSDLVIYSPAVKPDNSELKKARESGIKTQSYPQALGDLTKEYFTIAVSGTHGKSTTTAMISLILTEAGLDPTVIIGTKLKEFGNTNFRPGRSKYLVIEADEWNASFLNYWPKIIVLTNIEEEHLDYYKDLDHILDTYKEYTGHLAKDGVLVANQDDNNILKLHLDFKGYSLKQKEVLEGVLQIPGEHNVYNALASLTAARILNIPDKVSLKALSQYKGTWRRFEIMEKGIGNKKSTIVSDYAHHPTEVRATLKAVREKFPDQKIWCVFQPHQYQRTFYLFNEFVKVFSSAPVSNLIITDIYDVAGRETSSIKQEVSSEKLVQAIPNAVYLAKEEIADYLKKGLENKDILIIMGAGDIYSLTDEFST
jgi:UDP-N-acetylmuramate--alanine ligase